jgi:uncharacterized membrane protein YoaK (UPF0700 family)
VLSVIAGSVDVIGFLGLGALFIAHITGNIVVLAARSVAGEDASAAHLLSVPIFVMALAAARLLAAGLIRLGIATLKPLLALQFLLLAVFLAICIAAGPAAGPNTTVMVFAAMLGVSAMAVQNALVQISLAGSPSTAVMTTNLTRLVVDLGEMLFGPGPRPRKSGVSGMVHRNGDCRLRRRMRSWRVSTALRTVVTGAPDRPCAGYARNHEYMRQMSGKEC